VGPLELRAGFAFGRFCRPRPQFSGLASVDPDIEQFADGVCKIGETRENSLKSLLQNPIGPVGWVPSGRLLNTARLHETKRHHATSWPRVMQAGLVADAGIRNSDKYSTVNRLADRISLVPSVWGYAASAVGPAAICWSACYSLGGRGSSMLIEIGHVEAIFRYPVKSMGGERLEAAKLGWHGLDGDRRLAFRRIDDRSGFPWLTASNLPDLLLFAPHRHEDGVQGGLPTHIRTPDGEEMPVFGEGLAMEVGRRYGAPVQMMQLDHGIFDEANISVIAFDTAREIARLAGQSPDVRRFRPNVVVRLLRSVPFQEDEWLGGVLSFGEGDDAPAITVTTRDVRCSMVNLDPDSARPAPEVLKAVVRANQNNAGIYGAVTRIGRLAAGQTILLRAATEKRERG
jgi:uncharacterized protein YcbX